MKKKSDPRHLKRISVMQDLFSWEFLKDKTSLSLRDKASVKIKPIIASLPKIDKLIEKSATERPIGEINRIDLAILRLAVFELIIEEGTPPKVVIDEAVELAKEFGSDSSSAFVNGALGKLVQMKKIAT